MNRKLIMAALLSLAACSSQPKKTAPPDADNKVSAYNQGMNALDHEEYAEAAQIFDQILVSKPATQLDLVVLYDSGAAYEGLGDCAKAADRYRQIVRSSSGKFTRIESEALYRTSLMYECLGQDTKAITALLDARRRGKQLPYEIENAEIPARLAAAYARIGNRQKALEYFNQASRGLKQYIAQGGHGAQNELVAHALFLMGRLSPSQRTASVEPKTYLQSLSMQQPYLLQAVEMKNPMWSARAAEELKLAYDNIWKFRIDDVNARRDFLTRTLQNINELRRIRLPQPDPAEENVFVTLDRTQNQVQNELSRVAVDNPLTPEAQKREGLKQQGRLVSPQDEKSKKPLR